MPQIWPISTDICQQTDKTLTDRGMTPKLYPYDVVGDKNYTACKKLRVYILQNTYQRNNNSIHPASVCHYDKGRILLNAKRVDFWKISLIPWNYDIILYTSFQNYDTSILNLYPKQPHMSGWPAKCTSWHVRTSKTKIICAGWSESLMSALWLAKCPTFL